MGLQLVLVFPCFRKKLNVTSKFVSFLCNLDNFLLKNAIVFLFGNQISKWRSFKKKWLFLTYFSHFLVTREKTQKNPSTNIPLTYTYFAHFDFFFCLPNFAKVANLSCMVSLVTRVHSNRLVLRSTRFVCLHLL